MDADHGGDYTDDGMRYGVHGNVGEKESVGDQVKEFLKAAMEMSVEFGRGCRDIVRQTLVRDDSYIVKSFGRDSFIGGRVMGACGMVCGKLKLFNEYLPEDKDPLHAWSVILLVLVVALAALSINTGESTSPQVIKKVYIHPPSADLIVLPDGRYMAYKEQGVPADRARFSMIAPHSFLSSRLAGIPGVKASLLEEFGIHLLTYDLPGFGESSSHPSRTLQSSALDMLFLANALGLNQKFWVLGYSSGSLHAWAALRFIPDRLAGAAMFAPMVNPYDSMMNREEKYGTWGKWTRRRKFMYFLARRFPSLLAYFYHRSFLSGKHEQIDKWLSLSLGRRDKALIEDPVYEEFWQRDVEESIRQGNVKPFVEEAVLQVSNWGFSLADVKLQKKRRGRGILNLLKSFFSGSQEEFTGFLGPIHIWQGSRGHREQRWRQKPISNGHSSINEGVSAAVSEAVTNQLDGLSIAENWMQTHASATPVQSGVVQSVNQSYVQSPQAIWKPKSYGTVSGASAAKVEGVHVDKMSAPIQGNASGAVAAEKSSVGLSKIFGSDLLENFTVDNSTYSVAQVRATFYPKFENEKSDQEIRTRMIEIVSNGLATVEVSLKHSGSLFMYAGHEGGAYAKNSFGNIFTAVGVFVLGRMFCEAWGTKAAAKQAEFNSFLERNRMCISMELVTAVLGDHGQRPREDYAVVTAVTELGNGKPKFYSTPEVIAFCRKWRLPTNHVWLFSTRKSVTAFFAAYDALCEEGTASPVCKALDEVADISVPGSKDHIKVQGEILEGLVARIVNRESIKQMEEVLRDYPSPPADGADLDLGPSLRDICAANRSDEKQQIKALLQSVGPSFCPDHLDWSGKESVHSHSRDVGKSVLSKFLQSHPADYSTTKLQEMVRLMREKRFPAAFKCYHNLHRIDCVSSDNLFYKMVIHVHSDSGFRRYQKEMRHKPALWPLYRGFFIDINLFKASKERAAEIAKNKDNVGEHANGSGSILELNGLADDDANLMIKLKFLTYKLRTFLIRNGLSVLFKEGPAAYRAYYLRQMKIWGTSAGKQRELSKMLDEWAAYIQRKQGKRQLSSSIYLTEAESFLEQYAKRSPQNQALIGSAGNSVRAEDFLAITEGARDEEDDLEKEREPEPITSIHPVKDTVQRDAGLIVFFPGIPGCAKSALCKELLNAPGGLGDDRPVHSLMGDLIKGRYWQKVADERRRKPCSIMLADKNAPNEEVWRQIEEMCWRTKASAVPVIPDSEGTDSNPFSLDALAIFIFRVLQRVNHPGNLDKASPNAGYVLLMFYHLYEGKSRQEFEEELLERFGSLIKMPLLKPDRSALPNAVRSILEEGINLYNLHTNRHGRLDSTKGSYAQEWTKWEKRLRQVLTDNTEYLNSVQVSFDFAVKQVLEQLRNIVKGEYKPPTPSTGKRKFGNIVFAAVSLPATEIQSLLHKMAEKDSKVETFLKDKQMEHSLKKAHVTLAHKKSHGVTAVASYGVYLNQNVPVEFNALLFTDKMAALEAQLGCVDGEKIISKNQWPHVTLWTADGVPPKEANLLPQLLSEGKATLVEIKPPVTITGKLEFY